ncbi:MAG TPA: 16S rRNA (guanine(966)-N(2))-methyltransferase RsmD [Syntrophales bacterium]|nr:16S rRNA (guanine(966)-N(2))-methyltransferase RsmD [Syntrophales bacterium]HOL59084.1 16S rRNA (guanine(966)-N(2))-methyltransferase RsmD [Syntrophales bacterium]HPO35407.1 16S rRNA (guanine(966)-N(2))-methyltransferase RsmD [Syntrophales bacterium]
MRVIGGEARGTKISSSRKGKVRPTPAMVREALFNILGSIEGTSWADLYAGTGSVGLEALSRGASRVVFVEKNAQLIKQIARSVREMGFQERAAVMEGDIKAVVKRLSRMGVMFHVVFADPPYDSDLVGKTVELCTKAPILSDGGLLVIQHSRREDVHYPLFEPSWEVVDVRHYGDTNLTIIQYRKRSEDEK